MNIIPIVQLEQILHQILIIEGYFIIYIKNMLTQLMLIPLIMMSIKIKVSEFYLFRG